MKKYSLLTAIIFITIIFMGIKTNGQVAINMDGSSPTSSAMLDIKSSNSGILIPRVDFLTDITLPANGLLTFLNSDNSFYYYVTGTGWVKLAAGGGITSVSVVSPLISDNAPNPTLSIPAAGASTDGYLTFADWNTFNNKTSSQWTKSGLYLYYTASGYVGIGISNPSAKLQVVDNADLNYVGYFQNTGTTNDSHGIKIAAGNTTPSATTQFIQFTKPDGTTQLGYIYYNGTGMAFSGMEYYRFTNTGLGIGSTVSSITPTNAIHIDKGNATASYTQFTAGTSTGQSGTDGTLFGIDGSGNSIIKNQDSKDLIISTGGAEAARISSGGYLYKRGTYGEVYCADAVTGQSIPTGTTYTKLTHFTTIGQSSNCTVNALTDNITFPKIGKYRVTYTHSGTVGTAGVTFRIAAFLNGTEQSQCQFKQKFANASDSQTASFTGLISVTTLNWVLDIRAKHDNGGSITLTPEFANLNVEYIGE